MRNENKEKKVVPQSPTKGMTEGDREENETIYNEGQEHVKTK